MNKFLFIAFLALPSVWGAFRADEEKVKILFYHTDAVGDYMSYPLEDAVEVTNHPNYHINKPTVIYYPGYMESHSSPQVQKVVKAYKENNGFNVLVLDWQEVSSSQYFLAALKTKTIGKVMGKMLTRGIYNSEKPHLLHLVGHGLGAHLAGYTGRYFSKYSNEQKNIYRITGLDPSLLMFYPEYFSHLEPLNRNDSTHVDIVHTDANSYGIPTASAHYDFWPNGGYSLQPGCPVRDYVPLSEKDLCSTRRAVDYWADAVRTNDNSFKAVNAASWTDFKHGRVNENAVVAMGVNTDFDHAKYGNYFFQTKPHAPYGKGSHGIVYSITEDPHKQEQKWMEDSSEVQSKKRHQHQTGEVNNEWARYQKRIGDNEGSDEKAFTESLYQQYNNQVHDFKKSDEESDSSEERKHQPKYRRDQAMDISSERRQQHHYKNKDSSERHSTRRHAHSAETHYRGSYRNQRREYDDDSVEDKKKSEYSRQQIRVASH